jgi:hypothetical protein
MKRGEAILHLVLMLALQLRLLLLLQQTLVIIPIEPAQAGGEII